MFFDESRESMIIMARLWILVSAVLLIVVWRSRRGSVGLPLAYAFGLTLIHFSGALPYCVRGYRPTHPVLIANNVGLHSTFLGFEQALLGLVGLVIGVVAATFFVSQRSSEIAKEITRENLRLPTTMVLIAIIIIMIVLPVARFVPSAGSVGVAGTGLSMVGACLACWNSWMQGQHKRTVVILLISSIAFPATTLILYGFTAVGVGYASAVWVFVLSFFRPRWVAILAMLCLIYGGYSMYVNYMREREAIRGEVWGGADIGRRVGRTGKIFTRFEFFDASKHAHLEALDFRLNQNHVVGSCVDHMSAGRQGYARGATIWIAATAWVPRIIWKNKPSVAGSGGLVARYTGLKFGEGTSVGVGQIMEFYLNWGPWFVLIGMSGMGFALRWFDLRAAEHLRAGNYAGFVRFFIPAAGLLNVNGNTATMIASLAAGVVFVRVLDRTVFAAYIENRLREMRKSLGTEPLPSLRMRGSRL